MAQDIVNGEDDRFTAKFENAAYASVNDSKGQAPPLSMKQISLGKNCLGDPC